MVCRVVKTFFEGSFSSGLSIFLGGLKFSVTEGEHEDNSLGRNFADCYSIPDLLKAAHELGKQGEPLEFEVEDQTVSDDDEDDSEDEDDE